MGFFFDIKTEIDIDHREPDSFLWLNLFRIYKEALTNVMKHFEGKNGLRGRRHTRIGKGPHGPR
jgi:hypothetical protein